MSVSLCLMVRNEAEALPGCLQSAAGLVNEDAYRQQWSARREEIQYLEEALAQAGTPSDPVAFVLSTPSQVAILNQ